MGGLNVRYKCEACENCPTKRRLAGSRGNPKAKIVIVGESPGNREVRFGKPVVGPSGKVLASAFPYEFDLSNPNYEPIDVLILNAMRCQPREKGDSAINSLAQTCHDRLVSEIMEHPRTLIIAMGNAALRSLTGNYGYKITQERGNVIPSELSELGILPVIHPAALLRGTGSYRQFREDFLYAFELAAGGKLRKPILPKYRVYDKPRAIRDIVKKLKTKKYLASDIETTGFNRLHDRIIDLGVCYTPGRVEIFPERALKKYPHLFKPLFNAKKPKWIWHNGKFDIAFLRRDGFNARVDEDTMLLNYALDENPGVHDLEQIASNLLAAPDYKWVMKEWMPKKEDTFDSVPKDILYKARLAPDCSFTLQCFKVLRKRVASDRDLDKLYCRTLIPASDMLFRVERNGMYVNKKQLALNKQRLGKEVDTALKKFQDAAGYPVNPNSPKQVGELLYDKLKIPLPPKHGRSTAKEALELLPSHPCIKALKEFRKAAKFYSTYVLGVERATDTDGRVHATFLIHGTRTGRLSSRGPNLQNQPRDEDIRSMFCAPPGKIFIEVDLNQAELRSLAALSHDKFLMGLYNDNERSLHNEMADYLFGDGAHKDHEQKMKAKMVNFGIVYGREAPSIAEQFSLPISEGQEMIDGWFERCPEAHEYIKKCRRAARNGHTIVTMFGRKKRHQLVTKSLLKTLMNQASNFPHQSIASDITLHAAIKLRPLLEEIGALIVNLVHDSILIECDNDPGLIARVQRIAAQAMESIAPEWGITRVPFIAEAKNGKDWGRLKEVPIGIAA